MPLKTIFGTAFLILLCGLSYGTAIAGDRQKILGLQGLWKLELGDDPRRAEPGYDDSRWVTVSVPSPWEDQGFPGYDGYAWYRKRFISPGEWKNKQLYLHLGRIDDVDEVYVNGQLVGFQGQFPPHYTTAYQSPREYPLPTYLLNPNGENVIAVRVYDQELSGGILEGDVGIFEERDRMSIDYAVEGVWRLAPGDNRAWQDPSFDDSKWRVVRVPAYWDSQGLQDYDGYGWYRLRFSVPREATQRSLVLLLGRIDDLDETFLNGERIGRTGRSKDFGKIGRLGNEYLETRAYAVRPGLLRPGADNVLAVRVFDGFWHGGIYDGPIGLATPEKYKSWEKRQSKGEGDGLLNRLYRIFLE